MPEKFIWVILALTVDLGYVSAQKKALDHSSAAVWPLIQSQIISSDGRFVSYSVSMGGREPNSIVQAIDRSWKKELHGLSNAVFSPDNRKLIFTTVGDSLGILELGTGNTYYIANIASFSIIGEGGEEVAYQKKNQQKTLVLLNSSTREEQEYPNIDSYFFSKSGKILLTITRENEDSISKEDLRWLDRTTGKATIVCHNTQPNQFTFDENEKVLAFFTIDQADSQQKRSLRYYWKGMDSAIVVASSSTSRLEGMGIVNDDITISKQGNQVFFKIEELNYSKQMAKATSIGAQVRILGIHDMELENQLDQYFFWATVDLKAPEKGIIRLQQQIDKGGRDFEIEDNHGEWVATESNIVGDFHDSKWNIAVRPDIYLISTKDGSRRLLKKRLQYYEMSFSPTGKYFIWFDQEQKQWFCHNIALNRTRNITQTIGYPIYVKDDHPDLPTAMPIAGWLEEDKRVLIYGRYDIWEVDPEGIKLPINLTSGYGACHKIWFRYLKFNKDRSSSIKQRDTLILSAFDLKTKEDGFFRLDMVNMKLEKLLMDAHIYNYQGDDFCGGRGPGDIKKAADAPVYLLSPMSPTEYPNLCTTTNFREFNSQTDLEPQKEYNWYTTELEHWTLADGMPGEGILFKPENFDPHKKYPIIFYYYEKNAFDLNIFIHPDLSQGTMSIPWFVSNEYLVCVPDIYYKSGHPGQSACDAVVAAAIHLSKKPWVDDKHMGLQGHSYAGFETNYIISHSNLFVAAAPASGISNIISSYGETGIPWYYERRQGRIGATLWQRPDLYIENSPIFRADKVIAAVLIMHTKNDWGVPYSQGLQWYNDLHRLGKKAWFLTYEGEDHILYSKENRLDYSIRLGQFFDHFLKGAPAPVWMTRGVLAGKGMGDGLELDYNGKQP